MERGSNTTSNVTLAPSAIVRDEGTFASVNPDPETVNRLSSTRTLPLFVILIVRERLVPTATFPKLARSGVMAILMDDPRGGNPAQVGVVMLTIASREAETRKSPWPNFMRPTV